MWESCKARKFLNRESLRSLYYSFIYPYLSYCIIVWGATTQKNLLTLHRLQKKAVRIISNTHIYAHTADIFIDLEILNVKKLYYFSAALFMFKFMNGNCPKSINYMFKYSDHVYSTRQNYCYSIPLYKYKICQMNIAYKGVIVWNHIITTINTRGSFHSFKNRLKYYILNNEMVNILSIG